MKPDWNFSDFSDIAEKTNQDINEVISLDQIKINQKIKTPKINKASLEIRDNTDIKGVKGTLFINTSVSISKTPKYSNVNNTGAEGINKTSQKVVKPSLTIEEHKNKEGYNTKVPVKIINASDVNKDTKVNNNVNENPKAISVASKDVSKKIIASNEIKNYKEDSVIKENDEFIRNKEKKLSRKEIFERVKTYKSSKKFEFQEQVLKFAEIDKQMEDKINIETNIDEKVKLVRKIEEDQELYKKTIKT